MINIIYKSCIEPNCNYINEKISIYCKSHKQDLMIDIQHKRCIEENCNKQPIPKYKYCSTCLRFNFPLLKRWKNIKQKEIFVVKEIIEYLPNLDWITDKIIS